MTKQQARQFLITALDPHTVRRAYNLAKVVQFLFDCLDARGMLDNEPFTGMHTEPKVERKP